MQGTASASNTPLAAGACFTCRSRKTKCGRERPSCSQCINAGWTCPGYKGRWRFLNTNDQRLRKDAGSWKAANTPGKSGKDLVFFNSSAQKRFVIEGVQASNDDQLRMKLISQINGSSKTPVGTFVPTYWFLQHLPARVGTSAALDNAVKCLADVSAPGTDPCPDFTRHIYLPGYIKALTSLQEALSTKEYSSTVETLASIMLLQMFEQYVNASSTAWIKHAGGALKLIELRGPSLTYDDIELAILESQVGRITFECIRLGRRSFLAEPAWQELLYQFTHNVPQKGGLTSTEWDYHRIMAFLPGLLIDYADWQKSYSKHRLSETVHDPDHSISDMLYETNSLRDAVLQFWIGVRGWGFKYAESISYKADLEEDDATNSMKTRSQRKRLPFRHRLASNCLWPTMAIIASYMLLQIEFGGSFCLQQHPNSGVDMDETDPIYPNIDSLVENLVADCVEYRELVLDAYTHLQSKFPLPAGLIRESLALIWHKVIDPHFQVTHQCSDPILQAVGSLW